VSTGPGTTPTRSSDKDTVRYAVAGRVAEVMLNRPDASNAIDLEAAWRLRDAVHRAAADEAANVLLLHGAGRRFCAGGDLNAMGEAPDRPAFIAALAGAAHEAVRALDGLSKPVVVAVQGAAAGIGLSLVLGADIVVAGESAKFVTAYTSVGLTPDGGMSWLLPRTVGQRRALELILTAEPLDAGRALALGIVSEVCDDSDVLTKAREAAQRLAARPRHALGEARRLVRTSWGHSLEEHLGREAETITSASAEDETAALIAGFLGGS
jgi:2-(1,2-epoxy-1,2-dihydrophenyl)acetyl-CoA isomerase